MVVKNNIIKKDFYEMEVLLSAGAVFAAGLLFKKNFEDEVLEKKRVLDRGPSKCDVPEDSLYIPLTKEAKKINIIPMEKKVEKCDYDTFWTKSEAQILKEANMGGKYISKKLQPYNSTAYSSGLFSNGLGEQYHGRPKKTAHNAVHHNFYENLDVTSDVNTKYEPNVFGMRSGAYLDNVRGYYNREFFNDYGNVSVSESQNTGMADMSVFHNAMRDKRNNRTLEDMKSPENVRSIAEGRFDDGVEIHNVNTSSMTTVQSKNRRDIEGQVLLNPQYNVDVGSENRENINNRVKTVLDDNKLKIGSGLDFTDKADMYRNAWISNSKRYDISNAEGKQNYGMKNYGEGPGASRAEDPQLILNGRKEQRKNPGKTRVESNFEGVKGGAERNAVTILGRKDKKLGDTGGQTTNPLSIGYHYSAYETVLSQDPSRKQLTKEYGTTSNPVDVTEVPFTRVFGNNTRRTDRDLNEHIGDDSKTLSRVQDTLGSSVYLNTGENARKVVSSFRKPLDNSTQVRIFGQDEHVNNYTELNANGSIGALF